MMNQSAHSITGSFDRSGMAIAGVAASLIQDRRMLQAELDAEQADRNVSAARHAVMAVERQRAELVAALNQNAALRSENTALRTETARLRDELARMRSRALEAEGRLVRLAKAARDRRAA